MPKDKKAVLLAPMAGAADSSFRRVCRSLGAYACTSEMVSAKAIRMGDRKTPLLCRFHEDERPFGIQLFGNEPLDMAYAARFAEQQFSPDFIDINMGCPAPKITGGGSGSALMKSFSLACSIADAVVCSVKLPVTVKLRAGFEETNADLLAPMLEGVGVAAITVHGRTRERMYKPPVDLEIIKRVKNSVTIPVIGNGDIFGPSEALKMLEYTGCDAVIIGRAALGNPYIFA
ncbi:MAG: tRNA-dihydrouridine synthase family protein, partial [Oscillospiraceae bacterium]